MGLKREEFYGMTLGEFYEHEYAFEYKNSLALHSVRVAIQWKYIMNADPKDPKIPELHEIKSLWMLDKDLNTKEEQEKILPIEQRKTAMQSIEEFNF